MTSTTPTPKKNKPSKIETKEDIVEAILQVAFDDGIKLRTLLRVTCVNVFGNKWRINLWTSINNPVVPNAGHIVKSYFVKCGDKGLEILED
jgi:hypothetical protein